MGPVATFGHSAINSSHFWGEVGIDGTVYNEELLVYKSFWLSVGSKGIIAEEFGSTKGHIRRSSPLGEQAWGRNRSDFFVWDNAALSLKGSLTKNSIIGQNTTMILASEMTFPFISGPVFDQTATFKTCLLVEIKKHIWKDW